jgi:hypothetical protein
MAFTRIIAVIARYDRIISAKGAARTSKRAGTVSNPIPAPARARRNGVESVVKKLERLFIGRVPPLQRMTAQNPISSRSR